MIEQRPRPIETLLLHSIQDISQQKGGTPVAVLRLVDAIAKCSPTSQVQLAASPGRSPLLSDRQIKPNLEWYPLPERSSQSLKQWLNQVVNQEVPDRSPCVMHDHGIWLTNNHVIAVESRRLNIPRIVSPHGMLDPWAWQYKAWKKRLAWYLFQKHDLKTATALHATAPSEALHLKQFFQEIPIAIVPLGVDLPTGIAKNHTNKPKQYILFLSRIHAKKGLLNLVEAWFHLQPTSWELVIAGPDESGHRAVVEKKATELGIAESIKFTGAVEGEAKWRLYQEADLFVLPSFSENFGIVVAEALASRTPAIVTKGAPWSDLETYDCGWWIDIGVLPLVKALQEAMAMEQSRRIAMGNKGRQLVESKYSWKRTAENMLEVYEWLLNRQAKPGSILI